MNEGSFLEHYQDWSHLDSLRKEKYSTLSCDRIRAASWERSNREEMAAELTRQPVTLGEWKAGIRKEKLEWEVRDAVTSLWEKGYTTYYSGYEGSDGLQVIHFVSQEPPPDEVLKKVWGLTDETGVLTGPQLR